MNNKRFYSIYTVLIVTLVLVFGGLLTIGVLAQTTPSSIEVTKEFLLADGSPADLNMEADFVFAVNVMGPYDYDMTLYGDEDDLVLIFDNLVIGEEYTVSETVYGIMWEPAEDYTFTAGEETEEITITNNLLTETAWADGDGYNDGRTHGRANWATYLELPAFTDEEDTNESYVVDIYAGQDIYVGYVVFDELTIDDVNLTVYLENDWAFSPEEDNLYVQGYDEAPEGNPKPGKFDHKSIESGFESDTIVVPLDGFYGIHLNVYQTE